MDKKGLNYRTITKEPILGLGDLGCFDDNGVMPAWIVGFENKKYMYYIGLNKGTTVQFHSFIGLAISKDEGKTFKRFSKTPILDRNHVDPYLTASPCVLLENGIWRMWYASGEGYDVKINNSIYPRYNIKYTESPDGIHWERNGIVCIDFKSENEYALARPCVVKEKGLYRMWYSYKGESYRIGYAESEDGMNWDRKDDEVGIDVSKTGWDSEMIAYPFVFEHKNKKYMLYNGNDYGRTGFGYAVMEAGKNS